MFVKRVSSIKKIIVKLAQRRVSFMMFITESNFKTLMINIMTRSKLKKNRRVLLAPHGTKISKYILSFGVVYKTFSPGAVSFSGKEVCKQKPSESIRIPTIRFIR